MRNKNLNLKIKSIHNIPLVLMNIFFLYLLNIFLNQNYLEDYGIGFPIFIVLTWLFLSIFYVIELKEENVLYNMFSKWFLRFLLLIAPLLSFLMVEVMVDNYNLTMFQKYGLLNLAWYILLYFLVFSMLRDIRVTIILCNFLIYFVSMINYLVFHFRGNPILPSDLLVWKTGMSVASNYEMVVSYNFMIATTMMFTLFIIAYKMKAKRKSYSLFNRGVGLVLCAIYFIALNQSFFHTNLISAKIRVLDFWAPKYTYSNYGTAFGFVANVKALETVPPEGYSVDHVKEVFADYKEDQVSSEIRPNIIAIMSEAFSDLSLIYDYPTNMEYLPYTNTLSENMIKGKLYVSVFGGATSDTEYEFLTGNSMAVMPKNCVPYQQFITGPTDSLGSNLKKQGYYNIAIHPYGRNGYKRDIVYPLLGFDEFLAEDDFDDPEMIRSYISDRESYKKIIELYEEKGREKPLFIFNVTMQNHGGYSSETLFDDENNVKLANEEGFSTVEQYLSLLRETDKAFEVLTDYFSKQEEPTMVLLFGDHQPVAYNELYKKMIDVTGQEYINRNKYVVPFMIWANYDIEETYVDKMSVNYLSSYLLKVAGIRGTEYNQYLMDLYQELPVITGLFYVDKEDQIYQLEENSSYTSLIKKYQCIGYNSALDQKNRIVALFSLDQ